LAFLRGLLADLAVDALALNAFAGVADVRLEEVLVAPALVLSLFPFCCERGLGATVCLRFLAVLADEAAPEEEEENDDDDDEAPDLDEEPVDLHEEPAALEEAWSASGF
jgi:hypothetical protein